MFELKPFERNHYFVPYDPFKEMEKMEKEFFGNDFFGANQFAGFSTDIQDKGDHYLLEADLPGFKKEDIHIDLNGDQMTVSAERHSKYEEKDEKGKFVRCERSFGSYQRSFDLSEIQADKIEAEYTDGVLKLTMPKKEPAVPVSHRLEIH